MENKVIVSTKKVTIPTYEIGDYDKNPMFLNQRVYQGSSGKVYPHPICESVSNEKTDKEYNAIFLENDYIQVMILPELGGRIQRLLDKTNGYDAVYYNEVVKPALVGLVGPWISGGIEFNWPQHHRPSTFDPVDYTIKEYPDGSKAVIVGETEKMFHTKGTACYRVYPDCAYLEITGRIYNPTDRPQTFLWWANPAVSVNDFTRSIFPPDVNAVMDHGKRDVSKFPIADGVYYKVDYAPGTDISRYKNIPVPTSYMAAHSDYDFIGNYDDSKEAGLLHVADHHVSPGKKQWTWGNGDFGQAWDRNLTDENGPYIELMTGVFTDNQPDFTFLKPLEEKTFKQYFMPYKKCGAVKNANTEYALNIEKTAGKLKVCVYSMANHSDADTIKVTVEGKEVYINTFKLDATQTFETDVAANPESADYQVEIIRKEKTLLAYKPDPINEEIPSPAEAMPAPKEVPTIEELYLCGLHLEQYRHASLCAADYYKEGLSRDPGDIRINNAYGRYLYHRGYIKESIPLFEAAIKRSTMRNPNPYDCEAFYNLGLALEKTKELKKAYDAFYKATWDANFQDKAFYKLACLDVEADNLELAFEHIEKSLERGLHNMKARALKTAMLSLMGLKEEARAYALDTIEIDPLDMAARLELATLDDDYREFTLLMRDDPANYIELALTYMEGYLFDRAVSILNMAKENDPMRNYYLFFCTDMSKYLDLAEKASSLYCFPNRLEDIGVLNNAVEKGGKMAAYYLGCLAYDRDNYKEAVRLWEMVKEDIALPTVYRNLAIAYYNKESNSELALSLMEKAFAMDETDVRVFYELDELLTRMGVSSKERLSRMEAHVELLAKHDPLYTTYITLLNDEGLFSKAYELTMNHNFHPWEGGEGKITGQYKRSLIEMAKAETDDEKAVELLKKALSFPYNLGEGKLIGALDNDIYFYLAKRTADSSKKEEYYRLAARGEMNLKSAVYYNDQPPEMMLYRALAIGMLGRMDEAKECLEAMVDYGTKHMKDGGTTDYFAVSLPDFLVFPSNKSNVNKNHCENLIRLGEEGLSIIGEKA